MSCYLNMTAMAVTMTTMLVIIISNVGNGDNGDDADNLGNQVAPEVRQFPLPDGADYTEVLSIVVNMEMINNGDQMVIRWSQVPVVVGKSINKELALARREQWENLVLCDEKKHKNS